MNALAVHEPSLWQAVVPDTYALGESPFWHPRERALYYCDIPDRKLQRFDPASGVLLHWDFDTDLASCAPCLDGQLLLAMRDGLWRFDPQGGARKRLAEPPYDPAKERFNDGKCDAQGRFWGGTMDSACLAPTGALYRFDGPGRCVRAFDAGFAVSNGPTWSLDGRTMFFNDTVRRKVHAFAFDPSSGTLGASREFLRFERGDGFPDGMTTDAAGRRCGNRCGAAGQRGRGCCSATGCLPQPPRSDLCRPPGWS